MYGILVRILMPLCYKHNFMNTLSIFTLKVLRKLYAKTFGGCQLPPLQRIESPDKASEMIYELLMRDEPCMIARFGSTELNALMNYLSVNAKCHSLLKYIKGEQPEWWWDSKKMELMKQWSGFFPATPKTMQQFGKLMLNDIKELDLLGSWRIEENFIKEQLAGVPKVKLTLLEPYHSSNPWSRALKGKSVLVVHPFATLIERQYQKRKLLFKNPDVLPDFELHTIQAVQSLGGEGNGFKDWFEALDWMKYEMDKVNYDICLIGCGAYGFPLAAHTKRQGKKAVHLGGALQLLFGIKGKRWENPDYGLHWGLPKDAYSSLFNDYWVRPTKNETPDSAGRVEGGCYW